MKTAYGRFGFSISQADNGKGPFMVSIASFSGPEGQLQKQNLDLTEQQGLLLLADLAEFATQRLRPFVEAHS